MRRILFVLTGAVMFLSCKKDNVKAGETVEIYLLKSYQMVTGKCQIDPSLSLLEDKANIQNHDIVAYSNTDSNSHWQTLPLKE